MSVRPARLLTGLGWQLLPLLLPALVVCTYAAVAASGNTYYPSIGAIASAGKELWFGQGFSQNVLPSLENLAIGYVVGLVLGVVGGVLLGQIRWLRELVWPIVSFFLTLPPVILLPLLLLALGVSVLTQRTMIGFAVFILALINTTDGIRGIDPVLHDVTTCYEIRGWRRLGLVLLPAAAPHILASARVGISMALLLMVVGEMLGTAHGIGASILLAQQEFNYAALWAGVALLALLGVALNFAFMAVESRVTRTLGIAPANGGH